MRNDDLYRMKELLDEMRVDVLRLKRIVTALARKIDKLDSQPEPEEDYDYE